MPKDASEKILFISWSLISWFRSVGNTFIMALFAEKQNVDLSKFVLDVLS